MVDRLDRSIGSLVDRSNSERLRGFCNRQTDRRTFAILESLSRLKRLVSCDRDLFYWLTYTECWTLLILELLLSQKI